MSEEIVTEHPTRTAETTNTTVIRERSSGTGIVMALILLVAVIGGIYLFSRNSASESSKDNAVAEAAQSVGNAASKVGNAADDAVDNGSN